VGDKVIPANPWMDIARQLVGLREIKGPRHESRIVAMWDDIKCAWFKDDETPWCAAFVGSCLERAGIRSSRSAAARSYENWGQIVPNWNIAAQTPEVIPYGAVVVLSRPGAPGSGHVGFYCGATGSGFALLGGNQGDTVSVASYLWSRIVTARWPTVHALPAWPRRYPKLADIRPSASDA
jgi:uncharacterized protein (TIGR02594 family)